MEFEAIIARVLQVLLALGGAYLIATWFVLAVWTFRDIESRSRSVVSQVFSTLLAVFFWIPGVLLYMLLRPKETLDEAYQRSLEEEYLLQDLQELPVCPTCTHMVQDQWQLCPHCNTQLREPCNNCGNLVDLRWDICPYCGEEQEAHQPHKHDEAIKEGGKDGWIDPTLIEKRLREENERRVEDQTRALPAATAIDRDVLSPAADSVTVTYKASPDSRQHPDNLGTVPVGTDVSDLARGQEKSDDEAKEPVKVPRKFRID